MRGPLFALLLLGLAGPVTASDPAPRAIHGASSGGLNGDMNGESARFQQGDDNRFESEHHQLDGFTRLTGWQLSRQWYFGRKRGEDPGLGFVWQRNDEQMSISTGGIRFTRRF